jgi:ferredoxin
MKVQLDSTKCTGYGKCAEVCPSLFSIDEFGFAALSGDGTVPAGDQAAAKAAASQCPERAITIVAQHATAGA